MITSNDMLSVKEVVEIFSVTKMTVYNWIKRQDIKAVKVCGRIVRIPKEEVQRLTGGVRNDNE